MFSSLLRFWDSCMTPRGRMRDLPPRLLSHLDGAGAILDVGSFDGRMAQHLLQENPALSITGVDICLPARPYIPFIRYDGVRLPFADNSFATVMLIDVLHHDEHPERIVREALRVARGKVLIKDHYWRNRWDFLILKVSDYLGNWLHDIPLPYNFLKLDQWQALFKTVDADILSTEMFHYNFFDRCKQVIFAIEPGK